MKKMVVSIFVIFGILPVSSFAGIADVVKGNLIKLEKNDSTSDGCGSCLETKDTHDNGGNHQNWFINASYNIYYQYNPRQSSDRNFGQRDATGKSHQPVLC